MAQALVYEDDATGWRTFQNGDLPTSGVTAATYGDSTHVPQVAVNAQGIVTSASSVAIAGGIGSVTNVSSANTSISVANPTTTPVLTMAALNVLVANTAVAADWSNNSHKITNLTNGSAAQDAAAFGQLTSTNGAGMTLLFDSTLLANAASIDTGANGIGQGSKHLLVITLLRDLGGGVFDSSKTTVNGDTGAHYDRETLRGANVTVTAVNTLGATAWDWPTTSATQTAAGFYAGAAFIPAYTQTVANKAAILLNVAIDGTAANNRVELNGLQWRSTAAINQLTFTGTSGNLITGSRVSIYGLG